MSTHRDLCIGLVLIVLASLLLSWSYAYPMDHGQWAQSDPDIAAWYRSLMSPDIPNMSCCGLGDAYYADKSFTRDGKVYAVITDDRPDEPLGRPHVDNGTEVEVPTAKMMRKRENPTGHDIIFMSRNEFVYCFILGTGI